MKQQEYTPKTYLFIDESGDPAFYASGNRCIVGTEGFKPLLLIGMVQIENRILLREAVTNFMNEIKNDKLYNTLSCIVNSKGWYPHASYDNLEVQVKFIDFLRRLDGFKFYCVIGRKRLDVFTKKHNRKETEFYFDIIYHLLKDRLDNHAINYQIYLSARHKSTQHKLKEAIDKAINSDNQKREAPLPITYNSEIVPGKEMPELSIVDYMLWALQRYILKGEKRFFDVLEHKYNQIIDLYDFENEASNSYTQENRFDIGKVGKFRGDGYQ